VPPGWATDGGEPWETIRGDLARARRNGEPFGVAWADALLDALDGLPPHEFVAWVEVMLSTAVAWLDAYETRHSRLAELPS